MSSVDIIPCAAVLFLLNIFYVLRQFNPDGKYFEEEEVAEDKIKQPETEPSIPKLDSGADILERTQKLEEIEEMHLKTESLESPAASRPKKAAGPVELGDAGYEEGVLEGGMAMGRLQPLQSMDLYGEAGYNSDEEAMSSRVEGSCLIGVTDLLQVINLHFVGEEPEVDAKGKGKGKKRKKMSSKQEAGMLDLQLQQIQRINDEKRPKGGRRGASCCIASTASSLILLNFQNRQEMQRGPRFCSDSNNCCSTRGEVESRKAVWPYIFMHILCPAFRLIR